MARGRYLYVKTTADRYELPVAVADSVKELAEMLGVNANMISAAICHARKAGWKSIYKKVKLLEDDNE